MVTVALADPILTSESNLACRTTEPTEEVIAIHRDIAARGSVGSREVDEVINVDTYIHVFADNQTYEGGWLNVTTLYLHWAFQSRI